MIPLPWQSRRGELALVTRSSARRPWISSMKGKRFQRCCTGKLKAQPRTASQILSGNLKKRPGIQNLSIQTDWMV